MTEYKLSQLRSCCDAATPGPWEVGEDKQEQAATLRAQPRLATTGAPQGRPVDVILPFGRAFSDARFCATARTAMPELLDEMSWLTRATVKLGLRALDASFEGRIGGAQADEDSQLEMAVDRAIEANNWDKALVLLRPWLKEHRYD